MGSSPSVLTISELIRISNDALASFGNLTVEGEVFEIKAYPSGHWYFTLKDEGAQVSCAMWRSYNAKLKLPKVGDKVRIQGTLSIYEKSGRLQFIARTLVPVGDGALYEKFLRLKEELRALGWFDGERKKAIPKIPRTVGIITSLQTAALRDVLHRLEERAPYARVLIYPAAVQGQGCEYEIAEAIRNANAHGAAEVLLLVRGGGSLQDLWAFNEKSLARAILESRIPIISGVGHETDVTIADLAADFRAPTPTAAAEAAAEPAATLHSFLKKEFAAFHTSFTRSMDRKNLDFGHASALIAPGADPLERFRFRFDAVQRGYVLDISAMKVSLDRFSYVLDDSARFLAIGLQEKINSAFNALNRSWFRDASDCRARLARFEDLFGMSRLLLQNYVVRLEGAARSQSISDIMRCYRNELAQIYLSSPLERIAFYRKSLYASIRYMAQSVHQRVLVRKEKFMGAERLLSFSDPAKKFSDGAAFVFRGGVPLNSVGEVAAGDEIEVLLRDGRLTARVGSVKK